MTPVLVAACVCTSTPPPRPTGDGRWASNELAWPDLPSFPESARGAKSQGALRNAFHRLVRVREAAENVRPDDNRWTPTRSGGVLTDDMSVAVAGERPASRAAPTVWI